MTHEEMATELRSLGWIVKAPWTAETCEHPSDSRIGAGSLNTDGSGSMEWTCRLCGKHERTEFPARAVLGM